MAKKTLKDLFILIRKKLDLSQKELAEELGTSQVNVSNWERGDYPIMRSLLKTLKFCKEKKIKINIQDYLN